VLAVPSRVQISDVPERHAISANDVVIWTTRRLAFVLHGSIDGYVGVHQRMTCMPESRVDGSRLLKRLGVLRTIGGLSSGGVTRLAFSAEDVRARQLVAGWMREAGLVVEVDAATNLTGRRAGRRGALPTIATGSHLDTVRGGGHLDGAYGVVAALEAVCACPHLDHPVAVIAFANEEGTVAPPGFTGSRTIAGSPPDPATTVTEDGRTLGDLIREAGGRPHALASCALAPGALAAFIELHIEQGPVLEASGSTLGIVDSITGRVMLDVVVHGRAAHAGTTPMVHRRDALVAAADLVLAVRGLAEDGIVRVATTGSIACLPNLVNVVPGSVRLGIEIRDSNDGQLRAAVKELRRATAAIGTDLGVDITMHETSLPATPLDPTLQVLLEQVARRHTARVERLTSGAGHDAQMMSAIAPTAMLFVPSQGGISHAPGESTADDDLIAGAACLAEFLEVLDARL
jgi:N-carbamoyl-L-amino-acid hydrolase